MIETKRWLGVAVLMIMASLCGEVAAEKGPRIVLHLDDRASVPTRELAAAKTIVDRTFRAVGVEIVWAEGRFPVSISGLMGDRGAARHLAVMLVNTAGSTNAAAECILGSAEPDLAVASVFYNRIVNVAGMSPVDVTVVFGRVIAHEVGHLLLPPNSHSSYGIMRADLDLGFSNPHRFTKDQAQAILTAIVSRSTNE
jgi:hypothetical protein